MTQPYFIMLLAGAGLLFLAWVALAACVQSGNDAEIERRIEMMKALGWQEWPSAKGDYLADETESE